MRAGGGAGGGVLYTEQQASSTTPYPETSLLSHQKTLLHGIVLKLSRSSVQ